MRSHEKSVWSTGRDAMLMEGISTGLSIERVGKAMGISKGAAIGRFNRLRLAMGSQAV